MQKDDKPD